MIAATFTPLDEKGDLRLEAVSPMVEKLIDWGVEGIFVCGSTGEGPSLATRERMDLTEAFIKAAAGRIRTFVHVGHNSLREAADLAAHAVEAGADFISATPPCYFKIGSVSSLVDCLKQIISAVPEAPFYYYHIPWLTGVELDMVEFLSRAGDELPSLKGIKYTTPKIHEFQACLGYEDGRYDLLYGTDEMMLSALAVGARGFIGSTYNFAAPLYRRITEAYEAGDMSLASSLQYKVIELVRIIVKHGGLPAQKAIMGLLGADCGPARPPLVALEARETGRLERDLEQIGFFEELFQQLPSR